MLFSSHIFRLLFAQKCSLFIFYRHSLVVDACDIIAVNKLRHAFSAFILGPFAAYCVTPISRMKNIFISHQFASWFMDLGSKRNFKSTNENCVVTFVIASTRARSWFE